MHICNIFESFKDYLNDDEEESHEKVSYRCPEIKIKIESIVVDCLFDTGSQLTAMSEDFYNLNSDIFGKCPTLPLTNIEAVEFSGEKSKKIKKQFMSRVKICDSEKMIIFVVIKKLIKNCIFGVDALTEFKVGILIYKNIITIEEKHISYGLKKLDNQDRDLLKQVVAEITINRISEPKEDSYDIKKSEVIESIQSIPDLDSESKVQL